MANRAASQKLEDKSRTLTIRNFSRKELMEDGQPNKYCILQETGTVLVYFKGTNCGHCQMFESDWRKLQQAMIGQYPIEFGKVVVNDQSNHPSYQQNLITMMQDTKTPLRGTPFVVLYHNTWPRAVYKGPRTVERLKPFLTKFITSFQDENISSPTAQPQQFTKKAPKLKQNTVYSSQQPYEPTGMDSHRMPNINQHGNPVLSGPQHVISYNEPWKTRS